MTANVVTTIVCACAALLFAREAIAQEPGPPKTATTVDPAMVNDGAQWIAWYLALPADDLHARIKNFAETQDPPPFDWLPAIGAALADPSADARALAAAAIGSHYGAAIASADALRALLADPVSRVRFTAAFALARVTQNPGEVLAVLEALMHCDDADVRIDAARLLVGCDEEGTHVPDVLPKAITGETDPTVRRAFAAAAFQWLRRAITLGSGRVSLLAPFLDDADPVIRGNALAAEIHAQGSLDGLETRTLQVLGNAPAAAMTPVLDILSKTNHALPEKTATRIRVLLLADDADIRSYALLALAPIGVRHEWQAPLAAMTDPEERIRDSAASSLSRDCTDGPIEAILPVLVRALGDSSIGVQQQALLAALSFGAEATPYIELIAHGLDVQEGMTQMCTALFLGEHGAGNPTLVERLRKIADDPNRSMIEPAWALDALEGRKGPSERLRDCLARSNWECTDRVPTDELYFSGSLATLDDGLVAALFDATHDDRAVVRAAATLKLVCVLGYSDDRVRRQFATAASDPDVLVRLAAARRLATMFEDEHTDDTRAALDALAHDTDAGVRAAAAGGT